MGVTETTGTRETHGGARKKRKNEKKKTPPPNLSANVSEKKKKSRTEDVATRCCEAGGEGSREKRCMLGVRG